LVAQTGHAPVRLSGLRAIGGYLTFLQDPIWATLRANQAYGPFVVLADPKPFRRRERILAAGARFNREVLSDPTTWRQANIMRGGPPGTAARRLAVGLFDTTGRRHAHYRRLLASTLQKPKIDDMGGEMAGVIDEIVETWPASNVIDLAELTRNLIQVLAIALYFGNDRPRGCLIVKMVNDKVHFGRSFSLGALRVDLPNTPYRRMLVGSEELEHRLLDWAACTRGQPHDRNLVSIIANSPDENGHPVDGATVAGQLTTMLLALYDTCQNALVWTLILLAQHPRVAAELTDELQGALSGGRPSWARIRDLPLLDSVVKESLRILPPAPLQVRIADAATTLANYEVAEGSRVMLNAIVTNRNPDLYPDADRFKPERWAGLEPSVFDYAVFSAGPRSCPGFWYGLSALKLSIASILSRYRIEIVPDTRIDYKIVVTMGPRGRVAAWLRPNDKMFAASPIRGGIHRLVRFPN
jgi:cytochrome P450